jgi:hypothetical protein
MKLFSSEYGVARHIYVPMVKRAVVDYAIGADWTPVAGDVKISKDGAAFANVTNLPSVIASANTGAVWDFSLTATEMQAAQVIVVISDAATKAVEDDAFVIETFGLAQGQMDLYKIADALLDRNMATGTDSGSATVRTVRQALRVLRNMWTVAGTTLSVKKEDDATESWSAVISKTPGADPITGQDPT